MRARLSSVATNENESGTASATTGAACCPLELRLGRGSSLTDTSGAAAHAESPHSTNAHVEEHSALATKPSSEFPIRVPFARNASLCWLMLPRCFAFGLLMTLQCSRTEEGALMASASGPARLGSSAELQMARPTPSAADTQARVAPPAQPPTLALKTCEVCCAKDESGNCLVACNMNGPDAPVATPRGDVPLRRMRLGDEVFTYDRGQVVVARVLATERHEAPPVDFLRVVLRNGESFLTLPHHPFPDGGCAAEFAQYLGAGIALPASYFGIAKLESAGRVDGRVYEILPGGDTGIYWVKGVPMASSIRRPPMSIEVDVVPVPVNP